MRAIDFDAWSRKADGLSAATIWSAPHGRTYCMAHAGQALVLGGRETITIFDTRTGEQRWEERLDAQVRGLAVDDNRLFAALSDGRIVSYASVSVDVPTLETTDAQSAVFSIPGEAADLASAIVRRSGVRMGYALVTGKDAAMLAAAIAMRTDLQTIALLPDTTTLGAARSWLAERRLYGRRVWCTTVAADTLPFAPYFADLIVANAGTTPTRIRELYRVLRPAGGMLFMPGVSARTAGKLFKAAGVPKTELVNDEKGVLVCRPALPAAGEWRYQWADAGQSRAGEEARLGSPLGLLWFGEPGPELMMSRHWGTSTPLAVGHRVFVTGQNHIMAYNAYNGVMLWVAELPGAGRRGTRAHSANFVAGDRSLFVTVGTTCLRLDQATGSTIGAFTVPEQARDSTAHRTRTPRAGSLEIDWPTQWLVAGPIPKGTKALPTKDLTAVPTSMTIGDTSYRLRSLPVIDGWLDLSFLYGGYGFDPLEPGEKPRTYPRGVPVWDDGASGRVAFAFAKLTCPRGQARPFSTAHESSSGATATALTAAPRS